MYDNLNENIATKKQNMCLLHNQVDGKPLLEKQIWRELTRDFTFSIGGLGLDFYIKFFLVVHLLDAS